MRASGTILIAALTMGCVQDGASWAFDPIWLEADGDDVIGFQTWNLYREGWKKRQHDKFYVCAVVVALEGAPTPCDDCTEAWRVEAARVETDCTGAWSADPLFTSIVRVGYGPATSSEAPPHAGASDEGRVDYGDGWEVHGWAYPAGLDHGEASGDWPDTPLQLWPTAAFPLGEG